ncbi:protein mono-ADP-ribosyltransferase PARP12-like isoform X1 [Hydractinia symbiolongicarpus]|uniref:protein mono-ADP-ribosyltransferase PARP12-like isoform X1 n=1 Tax=Hydractinia symbiolongicarpus TaxID=13093 RepID=UPI00254D96F1|nr:protein mono-ADP-ribosyltransferase PARP12-like isoform X1 [Hydractinia symbiolongicarpus]
MKEYQIDDDNFRTCVIIPDSSEVEIKTDATSLDVFDWLKQEGICRNFLVDKCSSEMNCHLVHPPTKSPYLWQYKKACNNEVWNNFSNEINSSIEKKYCDPSASQFVNGNLHIMFSSGISPCGTYDGYNVTVRRLSTMSAVQTAAEEAFISTEWKWYWQMNVEKWEEYKHNDKCNPFEKAYIKGDQHCNFSTNQFKYKLYFQEMTQENQDERYRTKRNVRRRPVFKEAELIRKKLALSALYRTPSHWPVTFKPGQRIPLQDAAISKKLKDSFGLTMSSFQVITIEEICHSAHFAQFQIKKDEFSKRLTNVNEMTLYHGTSHTVIDQICVQNFDWRVCGKNATHFGQGSYFSNNASYSHKYSTSDASGIFYMFVAEVLVGQYAKGVSSMKRPPNLPNSNVELYDSCVNDVNNPIIFVIYERDQCYPRYLLSYRQRPYFPLPDKLMRR